MALSNNLTLYPSLSPTLDFRQVSPEFYFDRTQRTWSGCLAYGQYHGYELASIENEDEATSIRSFMISNAQQSPNTQTIWTGGYLPPFDDSWVWTDGSFFNEMLWAPTEPDNGGGCVFLNDFEQLEDDDCKSKHICLYRIRHTNTPSISTAPSLKPSSSASPSTTSKPSASAAPSYKPSMSLSPTHTVSPTNAFNIGSASVVFQISQNPLMEVTHLIGKGAISVRTDIFNHDCKNEPEDKIRLVDAIAIVSTGQSGRKVKYIVEFDLETAGAFVSSDVNISSATTFEFCTRVELLDETDFSISSMKQQFTLGIEFNVGFASIDLGTMEQGDISTFGVDEFTFGMIEFFGVTACQCQTDFTCSSAEVEQNTKVGICIMTSSAAVEYKDFDLTIKGDGDTGFSYQPVVVGINGSEGLFGTTIETNGQVTKISFPLVTGLFDDNASKIEVSGDGFLEFVTDNSRVVRKHRAAFQIVAEDAVIRGFELEVSLFTPVESGCFNNILKRIKNLF